MTKEGKEFHELILVYLLSCGCEHLEFLAHQCRVEELLELKLVRIGTTRRGSHQRGDSVARVANEERFL